MNHHNYRKHLANCARVAVALCALAALGGRAAQAQVTQLFMPSQLGPGASVTPQYSFGDANGAISSPYSPMPPGFIGTTITFTSQPEPTGPTAFEAFTNQPNPFTNLPSLDTTAFPYGTNVIDTFDQNTHLPTGPLIIDFSTPISAFGLFGQSGGASSYHFSFTVYGGPGGTVPLDAVPFTTPDVPNSQGSGPTQGGTATFVGAQTAVPLITRVVLSSISSGGAATNDFYFGPLSYQVLAPVPEASTVVSFGMGTLLFAGMVLAAHRRKVNSGRQTAPQTAG